ncbi:MAG: amidohydrolase family protein [Acidobacteriia bacterium]|nr:amidohydrolase family protein [Terriglobia bacterium]
MQGKTYGPGTLAADCARAGFQPVDRRKRLSHQAPARVLALLAAFCLSGAAQELAIVGGTVIDGNGGAALSDAVIVVSGQRISAVGPRASVRIPAGATIIDAAGRYVVPGFIDTNVHLSLYGGARDRYETLARYYPRENEIVLEAAQLQLRYGVTTVRDSYGMLTPLTKVRDSIARGEAVGSRILAAGNIVGWGGPYSITFSLTPQKDLTRFQEEMNDAISQGAGEDLADMTPDELRTAIGKYLDKGPDFLKYGGTSHFSQPTYIGFSPEAQKVMVEEAHKRGRAAETHSTTIEGLRLSIQAGIDLIQHPELLTPREMPDDLVRLIRERNIICSMLVSTITGEAWEKHLKAKAEAEKKLQEADKKGPARPRTFVEERRRAADLGVDLDTRRRNAQKLIQAGATITVGTDNYWGAAPEFAIDPKPDSQSHGIGTIMAIEGLVELGMSPAQAIVAGTKNGAIACRMQNDLGTLEKGKLADLVILDADPLADIHNIRKVRSVMKGGRPIDPARLPEKRVLSSPRPVLSAENRALLLNPDAPEMNRQAPDVFRVRFATSKGSIVAEMHRDWAPKGVDRFYNLVRAGYYDDGRFHRVVQGRWAQFGVNGDPQISKVWRTRTIPDEPRRESNVRGTIAYAFAVPNGRTTQIFINTRDNRATHDAEPFVPIGQVIEGMDVVDRLNSEYGDTSGGGIRGGKQRPLFEEGNAWLDRNYPRLDRIERATVE